MRDQEKLRHGEGKQRVYEVNEGGEGSVSRGKCCQGRVMGGDNWILADLASAERYSSCLGSWRVLRRELWLQGIEN
jgi:hypothetical protein